MITNVRRKANQPSTQGAVDSDSEIAVYLNEAQGLLYQAVVDADETFFEEKDTTLGFIASQEEYTLPDVVKDRKITLIERTDTTPASILWAIRRSERNWHYGTSVVERCFLRGNTLGLSPAPSTTVSTNIQITYIRILAPMHYATAVSGTSANINFATSSGVTAGSLTIFPPALYIGEKIRIISGTGIGQERLISAYNSSTRLATVSSNWSTTPDATSVYSIVSSIPEDFHYVMEWYAAMIISAKIEDVRAEFCARMYADGMAKLTTFIERRIRYGGVHISSVTADDQY